MKKVQILGVTIDDIPMQESVVFAIELLKKPGKHFIVTPNPEFLVFAQSDGVFKEILNKADLSIPDGIGLKLSGKIQNRVAGVDFMDKLCEKLSEKGFSIGLLGGKKGVAMKAAECLKKKYPSLKITLCEEKIEVDKEGNTKAKNVEIPKTDILFVGLGHPKQEKWIAKNLGTLPVKVAIGVGGSFDYIAGVVPRAPVFLRALGLEWFFRLILQPWRIKRQLNLLKFVWLLFIS